MANEYYVDIELIELEKMSNNFYKILNLSKS